MEKYGVEEQNDKNIKEADKKKKNTCPTPGCDEPLEDIEKTGVKKCPDCGTEPFE